MTSPISVCTLHRDLQGFCCEEGEICPFLKTEPPAFVPTPQPTLKAADIFCRIGKVVGMAGLALSAAMMTYALWGY